MIREVDSDGNGEIDFSEFAGMMHASLRELSNHDRVGEVFSIFDHGMKERGREGEREREREKEGGRGGKRERTGG